VLRENDERWESLSDNDRRRMELMARAVVSRLLHEPTLRLKDTAGDRAYHYVDALRELFALEGSETSGEAAASADVASLDDARRKQSRSA
jgi:glutamyl-tRNA reductase